MTEPFDRYDHATIKGRKQHVIVKNVVASGDYIVVDAKTGQLVDDGPKGLLWPQTALRRRGNLQLVR